MPVKTQQRKPRQPFTDKEDTLLVKYLAKYNPDGKGRRGNQIWETLAANADKKWPWAKTHSAQAWREHYKKDAQRFDLLIAKRLAKTAANADQEPPRLPPPTQAGPSKPQKGEGRRPRTEFTRDDELNLVKYLAIENPSSRDRMGNQLYKDLVRNEKGLWPWHERHSWHSWREKYKKNPEQFDDMISNYQRRFKIAPEKRVDSSLWRKLPKHVTEDHVKPLHAFESEDDEDDEQPQEDSDGDDISSAEVSQLLRPSESATQQESQQSSQSRSSSKVAKSAKSHGKRRRASGMSDEEDNDENEPAPPTASTKKGKRVAQKALPSTSSKPREPSSAPVILAKKRVPIRRTASEGERPAKRRKVATEVVVISDSE